MDGADRDRLAAEVLQRTDTGGELGETLRHLAAIPSQTFRRFILCTVAGAPGQQLIETAQRAANLIGSTTEAALLFYPLGWAPSGSIPVSVCERGSEGLSRLWLGSGRRGVLIEGWNETPTRQALSQYN